MDEPRRWADDMRRGQASPFWQAMESQIRERLERVQRALEIEALDREIYRAQGRALALRWVLGLPETLIAKAQQVERETEGKEGEEG